MNYTQNSRNRTFIARLLSIVHEAQLLNSFATFGHRPMGLAGIVTSDTAVVDTLI